ncbi:O-antigen ligase family protein [Algibacter lectus]|uniref:O-antigen ligase-related domain-containing protein n=1 Tax=Algibacter lectus TaxID=221126 RepID=A0A090VFY8_9FLAO|nr:O-antigen ligase family protein [Algibacter lectus]GAL62284.1 hypothetical protein JCM19300_3035 [Algibacter lectus]
MIRTKTYILNGLFLFFAFFPIIPNSVKGLPVVLLFLGSLFLKQKKKINWNWFLINSSIFFLYIISLTYTQNISYGIRIIETALTFLIIPLVFFILRPQIKISQQLRTKFLVLFIVSTTIFSLFALFYIITDNKTEYFKDFYSNKFRIIVENIPLIGQHPSYASIYLGISLIFIIHLFKRNLLSYKKQEKLFLIFSGFINIVLLLMLSSRGVIFSLIILLILYLVKNIVRGKKQKQGFVFLCLLFICVLMLFTFNRRMNEMIKFDTYTSLNSNYSNSFRVNIYNCAINIFKGSPFWGYGVGDAQDELNNCYSYKDQLLLNNNYNSHNQYLDFSIKLGLLGLVAFMVFLIANYQYAKSSKDELLMCVIIFYCMNFFSENILVRQSGLILFIFFIHFFRINKQPILIK